MKITPREKRRHAVEREKNESPFLAWGDFNARSRFARSTRKNGGLLVVYSELEYNLRNCSELGKKLLETKKIARNTRSCLPSNLWKALGLGWGIEGGRPGKERKVAGGSSSTGGGSFGPPASPLACVTCIPYL